MLKLHMIALCLGFCMDLCFGDPRWLPHPVRWIGRWISKAEKLLRPCFKRSEKGERRAGVLLVCSVVIPVGLVTAVILAAAFCLHPLAYLAVESLMTYQLLAVKSLKDESMKVCHALKAGDLEGARYAVSMIVGRDTKPLTDLGITKAAVETVAENTSDGVIAPLFYTALGGPVLGWIYKAVNTMDSMVGYQNEAYLNFGRAAARLDDLVNFIPARLAALLMIAASFLTGLDGRGAWRIFRRDRFCHKSPNSAQTEAACAGALGIRLAGDAWYFGVLHQKPTIGDPIRETEYEDIRRANRLLYGTAVLALLLVQLALAWLWKKGTVDL